MAAAKTNTNNAATLAAAKRRTQSNRGDSLVPMPGVKYANAAAPANPALGSVSPAQSKSPVLNQPAGSSVRTVEIAPAPQPFLNPDDEAARSTDLAQQDSYLAGLGQQLTSLQIDTTQRLGDIERSLGQGLESNDWNTAARGIANSSIRGQNRAQMTAQANANTAASNDQLGNFQKYASGEQNRVDTIVKPGINTHYDAVAKANAAKIGPTFGDVTTPADAAPVDPGLAASAASGAAPLPTEAPGAGTMAAQPAGGTPKGVVKGGFFYHVYGQGTAQERWVKVRPASGGQGSLTPLPGVSYA